VLWSSREFTPSAMEAPSFALVFPKAMGVKLLALDVVAMSAK